MFFFFLKKKKINEILAYPYIKEKRKVSWAVGCAMIRWSLVFFFPEDPVSLFVFWAFFDSILIH
jgi:hypothetical protein